MNMPPGKTLFVVISRSLCECHMNAKARSLDGLACVLLGSRLEQFGVLVAVPAIPVTQPEDPAVSVRSFVSERSGASGRSWGLPPYQAPLAKMFALGSVAGPPPGMSPSGLTSSGLL